MVGAGPEPIRSVEVGKTSEGPTMVGGRGDVRNTRKLSGAIALTAVAGVACWLAVGVSWAAHRGSPPVIVSGTVVNNLKLPLRAVKVDLYYPSVVGQTQMKPLRVGSATTDTRGHFVVRAAATPAFAKYSSRSGGWLTLDLLAGKSSLALHRGIRRKPLSGRWIGPPAVAGRTDLGLLVLAPGQPGVEAVIRNGSDGGGAQGWLYGSVLRAPGSDPRSGGGGDGPTVPVSGDTIVARDAAGSASAVSARDGSFQMRVPAGLITVTEDICGVSKQVMIESSGAARVALEIPNSC
jgi:hypothetical protein